jgi:hypothetical protein
MRLQRGFCLHVPDFITDLDQGARDEGKFGHLQIRMMGPPLVGLGFRKRRRMERNWP